MFEYTDDPIRDRFKQLADAEVSALLELPCLFLTEGTSSERVRIGRVKRLGVRNRIVRIEFECYDSTPVLTNNDLRKAMWDLDIAEFEFSRNHWAIKDIDLWAAFRQSALLSEEQIEALQPASLGPRAALSDHIRPKVFSLPRTGVERDLVAVMMPFRPEFDQVFRSIEASAKALSLRCLNANQVWEKEEIIQDIFSLIYRSKIVCCDFSGRNPNVFYEAGIAHTLGRDVVPIVQNPGDIPFDLSHHRYIRYLNNGEGLRQLQSELTERFRTLKDRPLS